MTNVIGVKGIFTDGSFYVWLIFYLMFFRVVAQVPILILQLINNIYITIIIGCCIILYQLFILYKIPTNKNIFIAENEGQGSDPEFGDTLTASAIIIVSIYNMIIEYNKYSSSPIAAIPNIQSQAINAVQAGGRLLHRLLK